MSLDAYWTISMLMFGIAVLLIDANLLRIARALEKLKHD